MRSSVNVMGSAVMTMVSARRRHGGVLPGRRADGEERRAGGVAQEALQEVRGELARREGLLHARSGSGKGAAASRNAATDACNGRITGDLQ